VHGGEVAVACVLIVLLVVLSQNSFGVPVGLRPLLCRFLLGWDVHVHDQGCRVVGRCVRDEIGVHGGEVAMASSEGVGVEVLVVVSQDSLGVVSLLVGGLRPCRPQVRA